MCATAATDHPFDSSDELCIGQYVVLHCSLDLRFRDGRIEEIAEYCESDVINTYRVWLGYELFRGK
jgi:hypothetical protein